MHGWGGVSAIGLRVGLDWESRTTARSGMRHIASSCVSYPHVHVFSNTWVPMQSGNETNDQLKSGPAKAVPSRVATPPLTYIRSRAWHDYTWWVMKSSRPSPFLFAYWVYKGGRQQHILRWQMSVNEGRVCVCVYVCVCVCLCLWVCVSCKPNPFRSTTLISFGINQCYRTESVWLARLVCVCTTICTMVHTTAAALIYIAIGIYFSGLLFPHFILLKIAPQWLLP